MDQKSAYLIEFLHQTISRADELNSSQNVSLTVDIRTKKYNRLVQEKKFGRDTDFLFISLPSIYDSTQKDMLWVSGSGFLIIIKKSKQHWIQLGLDFNFDENRQKAGWLGKSVVDTFFALHNEQVPITMHISRRNSNQIIQMFHKTKSRYISIFTSIKGSWDRDSDGRLVIELFSEQVLVFENKKQKRFEESDVCDVIKLCSKFLNFLPHDSCRELSAITPFKGIVEYS